MSQNAQTQPLPGDAEQLSKLLELELVQKRVQWQQLKQRKKSLRSLAILFLFVIFAGGLVGYFFVFNRVNEERQNRPVTTSNR